jgi:hypothetical protein
VRSRPANDASDSTYHDAVRALVLVLIGCSARAQTYTAPSDVGIDTRDSFVADAPRDTCPSTSGAMGAECSPDARDWIYLLTAERGVFRFSPLTREVQLRGVIDCMVRDIRGGATNTPYALTVDRRGGGWSSFRGGGLARLGLLDGTCTPTCLKGPFPTWSLAFALDDAGVENLYVEESAESNVLAKFGTLDLDNGKFTQLGNNDAVSRGADLTATGDGRIFGFFHATTNFLAEVDRTTGHLSGVIDLPWLNIRYGWAFAFWGGSFWMFRSETSGETKLDRVDWPSGAHTPVDVALKFTVVGAGVSTCAPIDAGVK